MARPNAQTAVLLAAAVLFLFPLAALPLVLSDTAAADVTAYDELRLHGACSRPTDRLTGRLDDRRISGLSGIRVRAFFQWWTITGIRADSDDLVFKVGSVSAKFPARPFNASLECPGRKRQPGMEGAGD
ncbi:hypothetical protein E2562_016249 [Oryza meyeriana var. granulata]|uniref:Uncharacterized protein n=1 Tax=Oryza meyeriana var. granulata TaxID=110450 RepID=A0A6G1CRF3_9ORYZ|nr:hypothetical protein E2562_016249 [Oryza meyeriana var. granulata]